MVKRKVQYTNLKKFFSFYFTIYSMPNILYYLDEPKDSTTKKLFLNISQVINLYMKYDKKT